MKYAKKHRYQIPLAFRYIPNEDTNDKILVIQDGLRLLMSQLLVI